MELSDKVGEQRYLDRQVRVCYDITSHSFNMLDQMTETKSVVGIMAVVGIYFYLAYQVVSLVAKAGDTRWTTITLILAAIGLILLLQYLIRKWVFKENTVLKNYKVSKSNRRINIKSLMGVRLHGYEDKVTPKGNRYTVTNMVNGNQLIYLALFRGSIQEDEFIIRRHYDTLTRIHDLINSGGYLKTRRSSDELVTSKNFPLLNDRLDGFSGEYQKSMKKILDHLYTRTKETSTVTVDYLIIQARTDKQKANLPNLVDSLTTDFRNTLYRVSFLNEEEILRVFEDYYDAVIVKSGTLTQYIDKTLLGLSKKIAHIDKSGVLDIFRPLYKPPVNSQATLYNKTSPITKKSIKVLEENTKPQVYVHNEKTITDNIDKLQDSRYYFIFDKSVEEVGK